MRHLACVAVALLATVAGFAQKDSTYNAPDTLKVGNFIIVKKNRGNGDANVKVSITASKKRKESNLSTNWFIFDLGFANYRDQTNYTAAQGAGYLQQINGSPKVDQNSMNLRAIKSSNVNIWFFMQKLNLVKHVVNLKYGLGLEMYNFRFSKHQNLSYRNDPEPFVFMDSIRFSKNKLYAGYLSVPFMVNINPTPQKHNGLSFSAGVSAGYLVGSHEKQISDERGKQKIHDDFNLNPWRLAIVGEVGLGVVRLYGSYSINKLHKDITGVEQYPYAVGIRFSSW